MASAVGNADSAAVTDRRPTTSAEMPSPDWTHATRRPERDNWPDLCLWPSRSDWPVFHYDGRWRCSKPLGHADDHLAMVDHFWPGGTVAWEGPWVTEEALTNVQ